MRVEVGTLESRLEALGLSVEPSRGTVVLKLGKHAVAAWYADGFISVGSKLSKGTPEDLVSFLEQGVWLALLRRLFELLPSDYLAVDPGYCHGESTIVAFGPLDASVEVYDSEDAELYLEYPWTIRGIQELAARLRWE